MKKLLLYFLLLLPSLALAQAPIIRNVVTTQTMAGATINFGGFSGTNIGSLSITGKISVNGIQTIYIPNQTNFFESLIIGNGGTNLTHVSGFDGFYNTFVGINAGINNTTGAWNTCIGARAGTNLTTGWQNTFIGAYTGTKAVTNTGCTYVGNEAGENSTGDRNTFLGCDAGLQHTTGFQNVFLGTSAGSSSKTGSYNTYVGEASGTENINGTQNAFFGQESGGTGTNSSYNTAIGYLAGYLFTEGTYNTFVGRAAGSSLAGIVNSTALGSGAATTKNNQMVFGDGNIVENIFTGNTGIGKTSPTALLELAGNVTTLAFAVNTNQLIVTNGLVAIGTNNPKTKLDVNGTTHFLSSDIGPGNVVLNSGHAVNIDASSSGGLIQAILYGSGYEQLNLNRLGGNVQVGNGTATAKFAVVGDIQASTTITATNGFASYATNATMTVASTGATNTTGVNQIVWLTAATGMQLYDNRTNAIWSGTQTIAALTPITVQPRGSFTGTAITSVGTHAQ